MKINKNIKEWLIWIAVMLILYLTGGQTFLATQLQKILLMTGFFNASVSQKNYQEADYNFRLVSLKGDTLDLADLKGKTIFMNFWATWCPPCRAEMPSIKNLYEKIHQKVAFVMVSSDKNMDKLRDFAKDYPFEVYQALNLPLIYHSSSIPTSFVISASGKIIYQKEGIARYDSDEFIDFLLEDSANPR